MSTHPGDQREDLLADREIADTVDLLRSVSSLQDPQAIQREFSRRLNTEQRRDGYLSISRRGLPPGKFKITRLMLSPEELLENRVDPWRNWQSLPEESGGWLGELIADDHPRLFNDLHLRADPVLGDALAPFRSAMAVPLFDEGRAVNWGIMLRRDRNAFDRHDALDLLMQGNLIGRMTRSMVLRREVESLNTRLTRQLEEIAQLQLSLLPSMTPRVRGLDIATSYLTSNEAGGDYYDFFDMGDGRFGVLIADVSGHGAGAATLMAMLQTMLHGFQERHLGPAAMLEHANRQLMNKDIQHNFITAFLGVLDADRRSIEFANAGHHQPRLRNPSGELHTLEGGHSVPLGVIDQPEYESASSELHPGDTLVLFTDGVTEAFAPPPAREMFGVERLDEALRACSGQPPCVVDSIHERLFAFTRSRDRDDDQTIVALRVTE